MSYRLMVPHKVYSGRFSLNALGEIIEKVTKAGVFTDKGVLSAGLADRVLDILKLANVSTVLFDSIPSEPCIGEVDQIIRQFESEDCEVIVAIGGGSVMDTAKLCSLCAKQDYNVFDLLEMPEKATKHFKTIMIPTTAGTGAEATPNAIVTVPEKELKVGIVNESMIADYVILDAENLRNLPQQIAAYTGADALAHAIECFTSKKATPFSDMMAIHATVEIFNNLADASLSIGNKANMEAKERMLNAAFYAGVAITASGTTAVHALSYPLGGKFHIPHGVSNAMLLAPVMRYNKDAVKDRLEILCDMIYPRLWNKNVDEKADCIISEIDRLLCEINIPLNLTDFNVSLDDIDFLVDSAYNVKRLLNNNKAVLTKKDIRNIYLQLFK